jgi:hypothetical protein
MAVKAYVHCDLQGAGASARNFSDSPKKPEPGAVLPQRHSGGLWRRVRLLEGNVRDLRG